MFGGTEWIAPTVTGIFAVLLSITAGLLARRGAKLGSRENRAPDVQEMWAQQELDRRMRQKIEDMWWVLRRAFQSYYRRVTNAVMKMDLTEAQANVFFLTPSELKAIEAHIPDDEDLK